MLLILKNKRDGRDSLNLSYSLKFNDFIVSTTYSMQEDEVEVKDKIKIFEVMLEYSK